ncbi:glycosyltransferase 87 family protein [Micromonospora zamorensis]|uniref:glycosyltransferase 87 family protein n=1 Tax=Micromonospora zamorensis TaxID=709883 RepID=UPI003CF40A2E
MSIRPILGRHSGKPADRFAARVVGADCRMCSGYSLAVLERMIVKGSPTQSTGSAEGSESALGAGGTGKGLTGTRRPWWTAGAFVVWALTRAYAVLLYLGVIEYRFLDGMFADLQHYHRWSTGLAAGQVPGYDDSWQYPPGAALIFLTAHVGPSPSLDRYTDAFLVLALLADLAVLLTLARLARRKGSMLGAWSWAAFVPLLGMVTYARYDLFVAAVAVIALAATVRRPAIAGAVMAVGALLKVWPAMLLITAKPFRGLRPMLTGFVVALVVVGGALTVAFSDAWAGFTGNQADRGLQVEAVAATPLQLGRLFEGGAHVISAYGALELAGPFVRLATEIAPVLTVVGLGLLCAWWLLRGRRLVWSAALGFDVALAAVLVSVTTSRVFSPQYMLWLLALVGVCLSQRNTTQRIPAGLILAATALTGYLFPWIYAEATMTPTWRGMTVLATRNTLIVAATVLSIWALFRVKRAAEQSDDVDQTDDRVATDDHQTQAR